jgi:hypothetical protein
MASLATLQPATIETLDQRLSVAQIQARRKAIQELLRTTMRVDVDFGTIPGTPKPTLYKPGAEKICSLFQLAPRITVHDMGTPDTIHYQVKVELYTIGGVFCGEGIGTASSAETKYQWRATVCNEEYEATPDDRRRIAYKKGGREGFYTVAQVRTEPEDQDNTVLKMAKKRGLIDAVLTVTAASDIFTQDIEDDDVEPQGPAPQTQPQTGQTRQQAAPQGQQRQQAQPRPATGPAVISDAQMRRFHAKATTAGKTSDAVKRYLYEEFNIEHARDIPKSGYDRACDWADQRNQPGQPQQDSDYPPDDAGDTGYQGQF